MTGPKGNRKLLLLFFFCPETLRVFRGEAEGNIKDEEKRNSLFPAGSVIKGARLRYLR